MRLDDAEVLALGGWNGQHAKVLVTAPSTNIGMALVDTNGDGANIEFEQFWRDDAGWWTPGGSSGPEPADQGFESRVSVPGAVLAYGRSHPNGEVTIRLAGRDVTAGATAAGWWAVVVSDRG